MSQEIRSSRAALFCKIDVLLKLPNFHRKASVMESLFGKIVSTHVCNCTKKDAITDVFLWTDFVHTIFLVHFIQASAGMFCKIVLLKNFGKLKGKHLRQSFFLEKVAHHQACDSIKNGLRRRCFNLNFEKLLKALWRTPPVSASNFNSTFLTLRPC